MPSNSAEPLPPVSPPCDDAEGGPAEVSEVILDPRSPIEVASPGTVTVYDPAGTDAKPPSTGS